MLARLLVDLLRIGRELVPEAIQVDALSALDQTLYVRPSKIEVPEKWATYYRVPVSNAGKGCVYHHPAADAAGVQRGERIAHHVSNVVSYQGGRAHFQGVHHSSYIRRLVLLGVPDIRVVRLAHSAQVRNDDLVVLGQLSSEWCPHITGIAEAVQQEHGRSAATDPHKEMSSVGRDHLGTKIRRE